MLVSTHTTRLASMIFAAALLALIAIPHRAMAQESVNYKIGVVVMPELLEGYTKRKQKYEELEKKVKELQAPIDALSKKIEAMKENYTANAQSMSDEDRIDLETKIKIEYADYESQMKRSQTTIDNLEEQVLKDVLADIRDTIEEIAERDEYHLILNSGGGRNGSVLYFHTAINITPKILAELNKGSK